MSLLIDPKFVSYDSASDRKDGVAELMKIKEICGEELVNKIGAEILLNVPERNMSSYNLVGGLNHKSNKISTMDGTSVCRTTFSLPTSLNPFQKTDFFALCFKIRRTNNKTGKEMDYIQSIAGAKNLWFYRESSNGPSSEFTVRFNNPHGEHNIPSSTLFNNYGLREMSEMTMKNIADLLHGKMIIKTCCEGAESYSYNIPGNE